MKNTNILLQKKIKERDASKNSSKLKESNLILQKKLSKNLSMNFKKMISKIRIWKVYEKNQEKFGFINYQ